MQLASANVIGGHSSGDREEETAASKDEKETKENEINKVAKEQDEKYKPSVEALSHKVDAIAVQLSAISTMLAALTNARGAQTMAEEETAASKDEKETKENEINKVTKEQDEKYKPRKSRRPNRSAAARRQQAARAEARSTSRMLRAFDALYHRGCANSRLGAALQRSLAADGGDQEDKGMDKKADGAQASSSTGAQGHVLGLVAAYEAAVTQEDSKQQHQEGSIKAPYAAIGAEMLKAKEEVEAAAGCPEEEKKAEAVLKDVHNRVIAFFNKHRSLQ